MSPAGRTLSALGVALLVLAVALPLALSGTARGAEDNKFDRLGEKLYYNLPLDPEEEALLKKAAANWGESEETAAQVIVSAWLDARWGPSSRRASDNGGKGGQRPAGDSGLYLGLIVLVAGLGAVELAVLVIYLTWWRRNRARFPPWVPRPELLAGYGAALTVFAIAGGAWIWPRAVAYYHFREARETIVKSQNDGGLTTREFKKLEGHVVELSKRPDSVYGAYLCALLELCATRATLPSRMAPNNSEDTVVTWADLPTPIFNNVWHFPPPLEVDRAILELATKSPERGMFLAKHRQVLHASLIDDGTSFILDGEFAESARSFFGTCSLAQGKPLFLWIYDREHLGRQLRNSEERYLPKGRPRRLGEAMDIFYDRFPEDAELKDTVLRDSIMLLGSNLRSQPREKTIAFFAEVLKTAKAQHCEEALGVLIYNASDQSARGPRAGRINLTREEFDALDIGVVERRFPGETWHRSCLKELRQAEGYAAVPGTPLIAPALTPVPLRPAPPGR